MNKKIIIQIYLLFSILLIIPVSFGETTKAGAGSLFCGGGINIKDSFVLSVVTMCLPGILDKTYEWKQIKCQTIRCSYNAVLNDLDPSFCIQQEAYRTCKYFVGEIFAIPPMSMLEYYRNAISQALANPIGYVYSAAVKQARGVMKGQCLFATTCNAPKNAVLGPAVLLVVATDGAAIIQTFKQIYENGLTSLFPQRQNYCEGIDDIKEKLEEIVGISKKNKDENKY